MDDVNVYTLLERIEDLETIVKQLNRMMEFHGLDKIPLKYRKAFPKDDESPFFELDQFKKEQPFHASQLGVGSLDFQEIKIPTNTEELNAAKKRMQHYLQLAKEMQHYLQLAKEKKEYWRNEMDSR